MRFLVLALALVGCPNEDPSKDDGDSTDTDDLDTGDTEETGDTGPSPDSDGDGSPDDEDCDDGNDRVYPGADEHCDGVDEDCDGTADNDPVDKVWYQDADDDGYGTDTERTYSCTQPEGYEALGGDCDDARDDVSPAGTEHCDDADEDCDGNTDEDAVDGVLYYLDADGDGHGTPDVSEHFCDVPGTHVLVADDCDDGDGTSYPGAEEVCEDGADNGCDGADDCERGGNYLPSDADLSLLGGSEKEFVGSGLYTGDVNGDGATDLATGAYGYNPGGQNLTGRVYLNFGPFTGAEELTGAGATILGSAADDGFGWFIAGGDADTDGLTDLVVGAYGAEIEGNEDGGAAYVFQSGMSGELDTTDAFAVVAGERADDFTGWAIAVDSAGRLLVSAPMADNTGSEAGAVGIFETAPGGQYDFYTDASVLLTGEDDDDQAGYAVASADIDGDGVSDVIVGAPYANDTGRVYVVFGSGLASMDLDSADAIINGAGTDDRLGIAVATGDNDGDGTDDVLAGADYNDDAATDAGKAYVFEGLGVGVVAAGTADATIAGGAASDYAGRSVLLAGDHNGDGTLDLQVGATAFDTTSSGVGAAFLLYGPISGAQSLGAPDVTYQGGNASDAMGHRVGIADLDNDGYDDVLGASMGRDDAATNSGGVYGWWGTAE